jgi:hypothetical protein
MRRVPAGDEPDLAPTTPLLLISIGLTGQVIGYWLTVYLARNLPVEAFEAYVAAAAVFVVMVSSAPFGTEKLALRLLPPLHRLGDRKGVALYLGFAARRTAVGIVLTGTLGLLWAFAKILLSDDPHPAGTTAIIVAVLGLPLGVAASFGHEVLTALGRAGLAAVLFRVLGPAIVLLTVGAVTIAGISIGAVGAMLAWGVAWGAVSMAQWVAYRGLVAPANPTSVWPANQMDHRNLSAHSTDCRACEMAGDAPE